MSLFAEADALAETLRKKPGFVEANLLIGFRILQKARMPDLAAEQVVTLYCEWLDRYRARCSLEREAARAGVSRLLDELDSLRKRRAHLPQHERDALDVRLDEIGRELGAIVAPPPPAGATTLG